MHYQKGIKPGEVDSKITRNRVDDETMTIVSTIKSWYQNIQLRNICTSK